MTARDLLIAVIGRVFDLYRRALDADRLDDDGNLGALGIVVACEGDAVGVLPRREIGGQRVLVPVSPASGGIAISSVSLYHAQLRSSPLVSLSLQLATSVTCPVVPYAMVVGTSFWFLSLANTATL